MQLVTAQDQILRNLRTFDDYRSSELGGRRAFYADRLRLGKQFVMVRIGKTFMFAPSRFVGYQDCTYERHIAFPSKDGKETTPAITAVLGRAPLPNRTAERLYKALCASLSVEASKKDRSYWTLDDAISVASLGSGDHGFPDEVGSYVEGAAKRVVVNAYERDPQARAACIAHYGYQCLVCRFDFFKNFGETGKDFIHVHHLQRISVEKAAHTVDPIRDLRPVCPNCHAMLHRSDPPFSIEELIAIRQAALSSGDA